MCALLQLTLIVDGPLILSWFIIVSSELILLISFLFVVKVLKLFVFALSLFVMIRNDFAMQMN